MARSQRHLVEIQGYSTDGKSQAQGGHSVGVGLVTPPTPPLPIANPILQRLFAQGATTFNVVDPNLVNDNSPDAGSARPIHLGQAVLLDGVNQHVTHPDISFAVGAPFDIWFYYDFTGNADADLYVLGRADTTTSFRWRESGVGSCQFKTTAGIASFSWGSITGPQSRAGLFHISWAGPGFPLVELNWLSLDGTLARHDESALASAAFAWQFIGRGNSNSYAHGKLWGVRYYRAGTLVRYYPMEEGSGVTAYDASGNGQHGTLVNAPTRTTQNVISTRNDVGYTLAGAVYRPRNEAVPTQDVVGDPLGFPGRVPYNAKIFGNNCVFMNGTGVWAVPHLLGGSGVTVTSKAGTSTPTVNHTLGRLEFTAGTIYDVNLSDGTRFICSEGAGDIVHDVGPNGVLTVAAAAAGRKIVAGDLSGGIRYARVESNTLAVAGLTVDVNAVNGTMTITAGGTFDTTKILPNSYVDISGFADAFMNRKYHVKSVTSSVLTIWDRFKRDVTGAVVALSCDQTWGTLQDTLPWNLKMGFSQLGQQKIPARADGSNTDARAGLPLSNLPGAWHNMAETKIDFTGGVASPVAVRAAWSTAHVFKQDILRGNEEASDRTPPNYSNKIAAKYEADFVTYTTPLTRDQLVSIYAAWAARWGEVWGASPFQFGPVTWFDLDTLTANQKAGIDDCAAAIAAVLTNTTGARKHVIFHTTSKVELRIGVDNGVSEVNPLLMGNKILVSAIGAVRFNIWGCQAALAPWRTVSSTPVDINMFNITTVLRGSAPLASSGDYPRMEGININSCAGWSMIACKIISNKFYNTGFAFRTRSSIGGRERFSFIRSGGGNGCDARHLNDNCVGNIADDGIYIGGDDGASETIEGSGGARVMSLNMFNNCIIASKNNSAVKQMFDATGNVAGTSISGNEFNFCTMGTWTGATGTIVQPSGVPVPSQAYDAANGASIFRRDSDGSATAKVGTLIGTKLHGCLIDGWNGSTRTVNLGNLAPGSIIFSGGTMITGLLSWGLHVQNSDNPIVGKVKLRFDTKTLAGTYGTNGAYHLGASAFNTINMLIEGVEAINLQRGTQSINLNKGLTNTIRYSLSMNTVARMLGLQSGSDNNVANDNSFRDISASGFATNNGAGNVLTNNTAI